MENQVNHIFFIAVIGTEKETGVTVNASATLFFKEYPSMEEMKDSFIDRNNQNHLKDVIVISFTELTLEQYKKLYPNAPIPDETTTT